MESSWMLRHAALLRTYVSEELSATFIRMTRIGELTRCKEIQRLSSSKTSVFTRSMRRNIPEATILHIKMCLKPFCWQDQENYVSFKKLVPSAFFKNGWE
jgi:hypothetical protein